MAASLIPARLIYALSAPRFVLRLQRMVATRLCNRRARERKRTRKSGRKKEVQSNPAVEGIYPSDLW